MIYNALGHHPYKTDYATEADCRENSLAIKLITINDSISTRSSVMVLEVQKL